MSKSTYPIMVGDPILRTCRHCRSRVAKPSMCLTHTRTCVTCCSSRLGRSCAVGTWEVPVNTQTAEERDAERIACAKIVREMGFREPYDYELAEEARLREARA